MTILRGLTAAIIQAEMDTLGDEITYTPEGGSPRTFNAWVNFGTEHFSASGMAATKHIPSVEVQMRDVPTVKAGTDRITIAIRPGKVFTPTDAKEGNEGETWIMPLKEVVA